MKTVRVFLALTVALFTVFVASCEMTAPLGGIPTPPDAIVTGESVATEAETTLQTTVATEVVTTEAPKKEISPEYLSILDTIKLGINNDWSFEEFQNQDMSYLLGYASTPSDIVYALYDLDSNGTDELIISDGGWILNVFTMHGDIAESVICGYERSTYELCEDGYIINSGSDSADAGSYSVLIMKDGYLKPLQYFYHEYDYGESDGTLKCYFGTDSYNLSEISEDSMYEKLDKYKPLELEYTPIG